MSDNYIQLVPADPLWIPEPEVARRAVRLFSEYLPQAEKIEAKTEADPQFFYAGGNWSGVLCPHCGKEAEDWWIKAVDAAYESTRFHELAVIAPCCGVKLSLNDMYYPWQVAFGRFVIEAMNPFHGKLSKVAVRELEAVLGCRLRIVYCRI